MARRSFAHRAETFGLDGDDPWALDALRVLFHAPRVYEPLVAVWERHHPGTRRALERLVTDGWVAHQGPVVVDARSQGTAERAGRPLVRYRATTKGRQLAAGAAVDVGALFDRFPRLSEENAAGVAKLLAGFCVDRSKAPEGMSAPAVIEKSGLAARSGRWWVNRLADEGYLRVLPLRAADRRVAVPAHWRVTRMLCTQLREVLAAYPSPHGALAAEFKLRRSRFLDDIDPRRVGMSGSTDFDHDVVAQQLLTWLLGSPRAVPGGVFDVEPRISLVADGRTRPWVFTAAGSQRVFYQPDALWTERDSVTRRSVLEYERFQSRRDAWSHIERFCGYLATHTLPFEPAALRFVVETESRRRGYADLVAAFTDYALEHPERMPPNDVLLAVSTVDRVRAAAETGDALADEAWFRIPLPRGDGAGCVLHDPADSPYDDYFSGDRDADNP